MQRNQLFHYLIRVPKKESAFTYFQLEACEGLAFYSTMEDSLGAPYRDIDIKGDLNLKKEIESLLSSLKKSIPIETLKYNETCD